MNKLAAYQENGCVVCTVKAEEEGSWPWMGILWEPFHKMGLSHCALGCSCLIMVMFNGHPTEGNRVTMQWLRHINVIHTYMTLYVMIPHIACMHKRVEIKMEDG